MLFAAGRPRAANLFEERVRQCHWVFYDICWHVSTRAKEIHGPCQLSWPLGDNYRCQWKRGMNSIAYAAEVMAKLFRFNSVPMPTQTTPKPPPSRAARS